MRKQLDKIEAYEKLRNAWEYLKSLDYFPIYLAVYGSYNYGLADESSDLDYKAIVIPTLSDIVHAKKLVSTSVEFDGGLIDIKDIRLMADQWRKGHPVYLEVLVTDFYMLDPRFGSDLEWYRRMVDKIAVMDEEAADKAIFGNMLAKRKALTKDMPSHPHVPLVGYEGKELHHLLRLAELLNERDRSSFSQALYVKDDDRAQILMDVKRHKRKYSKDEAEELADIYIERIRKILDEKPYDEVNEALIEEVRETAYWIIEKAIRAEIDEGVK